MGKYYDDFEREDDYQRWLYYRESSYEKRELQHMQYSDKEKPAGPQDKLPASGIFRDHPDHQAMIAEAEQKYLEQKKKQLDSDG